MRPATAKQLATAGLNKQDRHTGDNTDRDRYHQPPYSIYINHDDDDDDDDGNDDDDGVQGVRGVWQE